MNLFCCIRWRMRHDHDEWWDPQLQKLWKHHQTEALQKLPPSIREEYARGDFMDDSDPYVDIVSSLVRLLEDHPALTLRDLFALCECRVTISPMSPSSPTKTSGSVPMSMPMSMSGIGINTSINEPIVPIEDEAERRKVVNDTIISYCTEALALDDADADTCTSEEDVPALEGALKDAKRGRFQNFDKFYQLLGGFGGTFETANQDIASHIPLHIRKSNDDDDGAGAGADGMNNMKMTMSIDGMETECLPMMAWLIRLGLATIEVTKIEELCG